MTQVNITSPTPATVEVTGPTSATVTWAGAGPQGAQGPAGTQPVFFRSGTLDVQAGASRFYVETTGTIATVRAAVGTAPTGSGITVDVKKNGATIFTNQAARPTIAAGTNTATATPNVTALSAGDYLTVDIVGVGTTNPGADLTVSVRIL